MPTLEEGLKRIFQERGTQALLVGDVILTSINPWRLSKIPNNVAERCAVKMRGEGGYGNKQAWGGIPAMSFDGRYDRIVLGVGDVKGGYEVKYVQDVREAERHLNGQPFTRLY
jgi:hypothetical protein